MEKYNKEYKFHESNLENRKQTEIFIKYIIKRFNLVRGYNRREYTKIFSTILKKINEGRPDLEIYKYIKSKYDPIQEKKTIEAKEYNGVTKYKIDKILENTGRVENVLDIGTEDKNFLDELQRVSDNVSGINISDGFCHYTFCSVDDKRFQYYDGKNIPFPDNSHELITMFSVIHHMKYEDLIELVKELKRVSKKYIFIKDVDLNNKYKRNLFDIQHNLYEDVLMDEGNSYRNLFVTFDKTVDIFRNFGFELIKYEKVDNFNASYYALFQKQDYTAT